LALLTDICTMAHIIHNMNTVVSLYLFDRLANLCHLRIWYWRYNTKKTSHEFIALAILTHYWDWYVSFIQTSSVAYNLIPIESFVEWRIMNLHNNFLLFRLVACNLSHWPPLIILILDYFVKYWTQPFSLSNEEPFFYRYFTPKDYAPTQRLSEYYMLFTFI